MKPFTPGKRNPGRNAGASALLWRIRRGIPPPNLPAFTFHAPFHLNLLPDGGIIPVNQSLSKSYEHMKKEIHVWLNKRSNYE